LLDERLKTASELGADHVINAAEEDPVERIQEMGGVDVVIATAVSPKAFEQGYQSLKRGGTIVFVALPADNYVDLPIFETVLQGIKVIGSIVGTREDLREVFDLHARGKTKVIYETRKLSDVNESFEEVLEGTMKSPRLVFDLTSGA
jgi:propanol-preferring alcohol dehydrogenase